MATTAILYWYERDNGEFKSEFLTSAKLKSGATFESEIFWRARDAVDYLVVLTERTGNASEKEALANLKAAAADYQRSLS